MAIDKQISLRIDTSGFTGELRNAATSIERDFAEPAARSAQTLSWAFTRAFSSLETALGKAAQTGKFSIKAMVDSMLADLARLAFERFVSKPITGFLDNVVRGLFSFAGARASGGPVSAAHAYLVGERGPELFVPAGAGRIEPMGARRAAPVINFHVTASDAESFRRSETQIAAMLARAVSRGQRGL